MRLLLILLLLGLAGAGGFWIGVGMPKFEYHEVNALPREPLQRQ